MISEYKNKRFSCSWYGSKDRISEAGTRVEVAQNRFNYKLRRKIIFFNVIYCVNSVQNEIDECIMHYSEFPAKIDFLKIYSCNMIISLFISIQQKQNHEILFKNNGVVSGSNWPPAKVTLVLRVQMPFSPRRHHETSQLCAFIFCRIECSIEQNIIQDVVLGLNMLKMRKLPTLGVIFRHFLKHFHFPA